MEIDDVFKVKNKKKGTGIIDLINGLVEVLREDRTVKGLDWGLFGAPGWIQF